MDHTALFVSRCPERGHRLTSEGHRMANTAAHTASRILMVNITMAHECRELRQVNNNKYVMPCRNGEIVARLSLHVPIILMSMHMVLVQCTGHDRILMDISGFLNSRAAMQLYIVAV